MEEGNEDNEGEGGTSPLTLSVLDKRDNDEDDDEAEDENEGRRKPCGSVACVRRSRT
jgi:hypothetical protein